MCQIVADMTQTSLTHRPPTLIKSVAQLACKTLLLFCLGIGVSYGNNNDALPGILTLLFEDNSFVATYENLDDPANANRTALIVNDIDLNNFSLRIADGVTLQAQGGVIRNGTIQNLHDITGDKITLFDTNVTFDQVYNGKFHTEWYGATGDGISDDSGAFKASFENASNIHLCENTTYNINAQINTSRAGILEINGNNATIISTQNRNLNSLAYETFVFEETLDRVKIDDLNFDGENKTGRAFYLQTAFEFNNVSVKNLLETRTTAYAFRVDVGKQLTPALFKGTECNTIDAQENGVIGDGRGASRCIFINWDYAAQPTTIEISGGSFQNVWGDDGDVIQVAQRITDYGHNNKLIIRDAYLGHASRRLIKGTSSGIELYNNYFESADENNPQVANTTSSGMITFSIFNDPLTPNARNINHTVIGNTFDGTGGYDGRVVLFKTGEMDMRENTFIESLIVFDAASGDIQIRENTFQQSSKILMGDAVSEGVIDITDNVVNRPAGTVGDYRGFVVQDKENASTNNLNIINNTLDLHSVPGENVFGLIYFIRGSCRNLVVDNNIVNRSGIGQRAEMLLVDITLDNTAEITNNFMQSDNFNATRGIDLRKIGSPPPVVINNTHSSGQAYPDSN